MKTKINKKGALSLGFDVLCWAFGAFLYSVGVQIFITPMDLNIGGLTGVMTLVNRFVPVLPVGVLVFIGNVPLLLAAWKKFGPRFIVKTVVATVFLSVLLDTVSLFLEPFQGEKLLCAIFGGLLTGIGLGLVFMHGATTGGSDIIIRLLRTRWPHLSAGTLANIFDFGVIIIAGLLSGSLENVLYSLVLVFISGRAMDYMISGLGHGRMLMIMTDRPEEVTRDITVETGRGVSVIPVTGGYTGEEKKMLLCVVRSHEVPHIRKIVGRYDRHPFIIITESGEVLGQGFKKHDEVM